MTVTLRKASPADADRLAVLGSTVWMNTYVTGEIHPVVTSYLSTEFSSERIAAQIADFTRHWILAELNGQLVGYAHVKQGEPCPNSAHHGAELVNLYILETFTRRGIGTRLLRASESVVAAQAEQLWLSVNSHNERAIGFYGKRGYRNVGEIYFKLGSQKYKNEVLVQDFAWLQTNS